MPTGLTITRNVLSNIQDPTGYSVTFYETSDPPAPLREMVSVENDVCYNRGVYPTLGAAVSAALNYIAFPCRIFQTTHPLGTVSFAVTRSGDPTPPFSRLLGGNYQDYPGRKTTTHYDLLPCPFCGGTNIRVDRMDYAPVLCNDCGGGINERFWPSLSRLPTAEECVKAWNRRPQPTQAA